MPEGMSVEVAHHLTEHGGHGGGPHDKSRWQGLLEVGEVLLLAVVAITTAWTGFQAAKWDGRQSLLYGQASRDRFEADAASTLGGQFLVGDSSIFTAWLQAEADGNDRLATILSRRFTPDYKVAFNAWVKTDPLHNAAAPPGPGYMPEYHNPKFAEADRLNAEASLAFNEGSEARENAEKYVRDTVLFATVLFLVAMAQRFKAHAVRLGANGVALGLLVFTLISVFVLPRA